MEPSAPIVGGSFGQAKLLLPSFQCAHHTHGRTAPLLVWCSAYRLRLALPATAGMRCRGSVLHRRHCCVMTPPETAETARGCDGLPGHASGCETAVVRLKWGSLLHIFPLRCRQKPTGGPAAQQVDTGELLMQALADRAAVSETLQSGLATFYSRSRRGRWCKVRRPAATCCGVAHLIQCYRKDVNSTALFEMFHAAHDWHDELFKELICNFTAREVPILRQDHAQAPFTPGICA